MRLRSLITQAKEENVPHENIERAIKGTGEERDLEEIRIEAFGPEGVTLIIEAITNNRNRTIPEIRIILDEHEGKMGSEGSALWAFERKNDRWSPKFPQKINEEALRKTKLLLEALDEHSEVTVVAINIETNEKFRN